MKFKFHKITSPYGNIFTPLVDIKLKNPKTGDTTPRYPSLVDSGANSSVFHAPMAELINIDVTTGQKRPLRGIMAQAGIQYIHRILIVIDEMKVEYNAEVGFTYDFVSDIENIFPYGILGQNGFFDQFKIKFDLKNGFFEIK